MGSLIILPPNPPKKGLMVLVDSSVWMEAARRNGRLDCKVSLEALIDEAEALICGPIRMEVLAAARPADRPLMSAGFDAIPYQPINEEDWGFLIQYAGKVADDGFSVPFRSALIAGLAIRWDCRLYTLDAALESMQGPFKPRLYRPGYGGKFQTEPRRSDNVSQAPTSRAETQNPPAVPPATPKFSTSTLDIGVWD